MTSNLRLRAARPKLVAALLAVLLTMLVAAATRPAPASAQWYWGCTYSWGSPCYGQQQWVDFLITQDPDHALKSWPGYPTQNGYKQPKHDGIERCVAGSIWGEIHGQEVPWVGGWGQVTQSYQTSYYGFPLIGSCAEYQKVALYQMVDLGQ